MPVTSEQITYLKTQARVAFTGKSSYKTALNLIDHGTDFSTIISNLNARLPDGQSIVSVGSALGQTKTSDEIIAQLVEFGFANDLIQTIYHNREQDHTIEALRKELFDFKTVAELQIQHLIDSNTKLSTKNIEYRTELDDTRNNLHNALAEFDNFRILICDSGRLSCETIGKTTQFEFDVDGLGEILK